MLLDQLENYRINKRETVIKSLKNIYGLNSALAAKLCKQSGICGNQKINLLESDQLETLAKYASVNKLKLDQELRKHNSRAIDKLLEIKSYKGLRRAKGYPVRGQRTHSNAKTSRKNKN